MKKKTVLIALAVALAVVVGAGVWYFKFRGNSGSSSSENTVFVDSVSMIAGLGGGSGFTNRFSGVVEAQETVNVEVASGMKVAETYVSVGQEVQVGTRLFSYDTEEAENTIAQLEIDIENYDITIESTEGQITQLEKERAKVSEDEKLSYTTQIMTAQNTIKRAEYEKKSKQAEMESLKKQVADAYVTSEIAGVVKTINKNNSGNSDSGTDSSDDMTGSDESSSAYMTIMATGDYRVKGTINEQNLVSGQISEGEAILVHSRVDDSVTWRGSVSKIDRDNATANQNSMNYGTDDSMTTSSSYPFYVELEDSTGLMLGQHVYMEVDTGQEDEKEGIWLDEYYLITDTEGNVTPYVWAATDKDRLEKREVQLGEYDEENMKYQILSGLTEDDYIAWPDESLTEGASVSRNTDRVTADDSSDDSLDDSYYDDSVEDGGYYDDSAEDGGDYVDSVDDGDDYIDAE